MKGDIVNTYRLLALPAVMALVWLLSSEARSPGGDLPSDAVKRLKEFDAEAEAIQKKADAEIMARRDKLIADLQTLQESYTKAGKLDEAVTIRDRIRSLTLKGKWVGPWRNSAGQGGDDDGLEITEEADGKIKGEKESAFTGERLCNNTIYFETKTATRLYRYIGRVKDGELILHYFAERLDVGGYYFGVCVLRRK
jgi:hypothetical protein